MSKFIDLTGQKFGRLTVVERAEDYVTKNGKKYTQWLCKCECGNIKIISTSRLKDGTTKSCGCLSKELKTKHNLCYTRIYEIFCGIKKRCFNKKDKSYKIYGDRGIKVCDEWLDKENGFMNFYNWAINNGYNDDLTIDRIDVNGNYEPSNCRWVSKKEQANNRRTNHYITYNNKTQNLKQWCDELNLNYKTTYNKIKYFNIPFEDITNNI